MEQRESERKVEGGGVGNRVREVQRSGAAGMSCRERTPSRERKREKERARKRERKKKRERKSEWGLTNTLLPKTRIPFCFHQTFFVSFPYDPSALLSFPFFFFFYSLDSTTTYLSST